jgi:DNA invertase Pin-like site-specific DNA recombinase
MLAKFSLKPRRLVSDETSKAIRTDAKNGMTALELARKYGLSVTTIHRHTFASLGARRKLNEFEVRDIRKMYKKGSTTLAEVAEIFEVPEAAVQRVCARRVG